METLCAPLVGIAPEARGDIRLQKTFATSLDFPWAADDISYWHSGET